MDRACSGIWVGLNFKGGVLNTKFVPLVLVVPVRLLQETTLRPSCRATGTEYPATATRFQDDRRIVARCALDLCLHLLGYNGEFSSDTDCRDVPSISLTLSMFHGPATGRLNAL